MKPTMQTIKTQTTTMQLKIMQLKTMAKRALLCGLAIAPLSAPLLHTKTAHADGLYLPELRITKVTDCYDRNGKLDPNHAWVYVNNQGTAASGQCTLTYNLYMGLNYLQIGDAPVPAIAPGQTKAVQVATPVNIHAPHKTLRFTVDAFNVVPEFIEVNNDYDIDNPY